MTPEEIYNEYCVLREEYEVLRKHLSEEEIPVRVQERVRTFEDVLDVNVEDRLTVDA